MKLTHHGIDIGELPDAWWAEAGMVGFVPTSKSYCFERSRPWKCREVSIVDVGLVLRNPIFRDGGDGEGSARERAVRILRGFRLGQRTHPVEVVEGRRTWISVFRAVSQATRLHVIGYSLAS